MKKIKDNISYIIGIALLLVVVIDFGKLLFTMDLASFDLVRYLPDILCFIGAIIFIMSNILGIAPVNPAKSDLFESILIYLYEREDLVETPYKAPDELMARLKKNMRDEEVLNELAKDIVTFCKVDPSKMNIRVQNDLIEAAGTYNTEDNEINISFANTRTPSEVLAVLIHECMHYILFEKNLVMDNREENEYMTDIACLYFGFTEYINRGYILVGYLKRNEIRTVKRMIKDIKDINNSQFFRTVFEMFMDFF